MGEKSTKTMSRDKGPNESVKRKHINSYHQNQRAKKIKNQRANSPNA